LHEKNHDFVVLRNRRIPAEIDPASSEQASIPQQWKWTGRSVFIIDGSTVSMPDTPLNQAMYPQPPKQKPGLGFPLARIGVLLSLATGACHNLAIAAYSGKGTGEISLFRRMYDTLEPLEMVLSRRSPAEIVSP
jgi:hypothetical protein